MVHGAVQVVHYQALADPVLYGQSCEGILVVLSQQPGVFAEDVHRGAAVGEVPSYLQVFGPRDGTVESEVPLHVRVAGNVFGRLLSVLVLIGTGTCVGIEYETWE